LNIFGRKSTKRVEKSPISNKQSSKSSNRLKLLHQANTNLSELRSMKYSIFGKNQESSKSKEGSSNNKSRNSSILSRLHERLSKKGEPSYQSQKEHANESTTKKESSRNRKHVKTHSNQLPILDPPSSAKSSMKSSRKSTPSKKPTNHLLPPKPKREQQHMVADEPLKSEYLFIS